MPTIAIFSAAFCKAEEVASTTAPATGTTPIHARLLQQAATRFGIPETKLEQAMSGPDFVFDKLTHKRQKYLAFLRVVLSELLAEENVLLHGFAAQLVPAGITHVLRVCLLADPHERVRRLMVERRLGEKEAQRLVRDSDAARQQWTEYLFGLSPWESRLYDIKIPMHSTSVEEAAALICQHANREVLRATDASRRAVADFQLAARAELLLANNGHFHAVTAREGVVTVTVDEYVLRLEHLEKELAALLMGVGGIADVRVTTGPNYRPPSVFAKLDVDLPKRVLLVDDEADFVLTLSERLVMRDVQPAIAHDGEQALSMVSEEEPEVIVLDLKMPGVDGIEVLRRVKNEHPEVEVIILTGHGSERDRELCMQLGAFAYLEKPVDIELLSETMRQANERLRVRRAPRG